MGMFVVDMDGNREGRRASLSRPTASDDDIGTIGIIIKTATRTTTKTPTRTTTATAIRISPAQTLRGRNSSQ